MNDTTSPLSATSFTFNTSGSTAASDIESASLYFTGTSNAYATTIQFGSPSASPSGAFTITGTQALGHEENYFCSNTPSLRERR